MRFKHLPHTSFFSVESLNNVTIPIHSAAQLIAMAGKFLIPHQADDSHTNMDWDISSHSFIGHSLPGSTRIQLALNIPAFSLEIWKEGEAIHSLALDGISLEHAASWIKNEFNSLGFDSSPYKVELHYELPPYPYLSGREFSMPRQEDLHAFALSRSLGKEIVSYYANSFKNASDTRTWPHHFDIGSYIPLAFDASGAPTLSIGMGLAIQDQLVNQPYFYITHWSKEGGINYDQLPDLPSGGYWNKKNFIGAFLSLEALYKNQELEDQLHQFMNASIKASLNFLGK